MSKYIALILSLFTIAAMASLHPVFADGNCDNSYGSSNPCQPTNLTINKQVQDPITGLFVENITTAEFSQGDKVVFKMIVSNSSGETFFPVTVRDTVPDNFVIDTADTNFVNGDSTKTFEISSDKKSITYTIKQLPAGNTVEMLLWTHLVGTYPNADSFCRDNWANVTSPQRPNGDTNFARVCVASKVSGATTLPTAGFDDIVYMIPFALSGIGGLALLKKRS